MSERGRRVGPVLLAVPGLRSDEEREATREGAAPEGAPKRAGNTA
jgi:hypothetical protein